MAVQTFKAELEKDTKAKAYFHSLSYTHEKEYVNWITGAKKEETRQRRALKALTMLQSNIKHP